MTIAQRIGSLHTSAEVNARAGEFIAVAKSFAAAKGKSAQALQIAKGRNVTERAQGVLHDWMRIAEGRQAQRIKSPVAAGSTTDTSWAAPLAQYDALAGAFIESMRSVGAFDAMYPFMRAMPLRTRIAVVTGGATATVVGQGQIKPISTLSLESAELDEKKAVGVVVVTKELAGHTSAEGNRIFGDELRVAVSAITDAEAIAILSAGVTPQSATGDTLAALRSDLRRAFVEITGNRLSKYFIIMGASAAKAIAFLDPDGSDAFLDMTPTGGTLAGVPVVVSDAASDDVIVVDANQLAANAGTIDLGELRHASLQFETAPDSPVTATTNVINLWQQDMVGFTAERFFGLEKLRSDCVAIISGATYGGGNSPA